MGHNKLVVISKLVAIIFAAANLAYCDPKSDAQNVCTKLVNIRTEVPVEKPIKYQVKSQEGCYFLSSCTKTKVVERMEVKLQTVLKEVEVNTCCPGYTETPDQQCAPICLKSCKNGHCASPGVCKCSPEPSDTSPGFVGATCNHFTCLSVNRWGSNCDRECNCPANSHCSASTGKCLCRDGWRGANCTEECTRSSMNCENLELPPILEPEANSIPDSDSAQSQKLEALSPRALLREESESEELDGVSRKVASLVATHMGFNLFLIILSLTLIFTLFRYKKRLGHLKNELYGAVASYSSPSSSAGGGSDYFGGSSVYSSTTASNGISQANRPRMPTPIESQYLSKNLSFASATRNILMPAGNPEKDASRAHEPAKNELIHKFVVAPKVESHLASSQKSSEQNIYTDIESNFSGKSYQLLHQVIPEEKMLNISTSSSEEENHYQVPRSPAYRPPISSPVEQPAFEYDNQGEQLYEEIKPRPLSKDSQ